MPIDALFFDAGNTLVFADRELTLAPLAARGLRPSEQQLRAAEHAARHQMDSALAGKRSVDAQFWNIYYDHLLQELHQSDPELRASLVRATRTSSHWTQILPGTHAILARWKQRYRLGVITNSDGTIRQVMESIGLAAFFSSFTESALAGYEKPDPRIFRQALDSLAVCAENSLYVGDIYSVDYVGARAAGMQAVLMDWSGAYCNRGLPRIESLAELDAEITNRGWDSRHDLGA